jgi:hypothetical protein
MARLLTWLNRYGDNALALILAIGVGILALGDIVGTNDVNSASSLRDRAHEEEMSTQIHDVMESAHGRLSMLSVLPARLDELQWDMTPHQLIITQEDPQFPAMMLRKALQARNLYQ